MLDNLFYLRSEQNAFLYEQLDHFSMSQPILSMACLHLDFGQLLYPWKLNLGTQNFAKVFLGVLQSVHSLIWIYRTVYK